MGPTGECYRGLQIHPTRLCNLRCLHCYSSSAPEESETLPLELLRRAIADATKEGYNVAGFSGGEPLLYKPLREALDAARSHGMVTTVTSNGMLLDERRLEILCGAVDLLAISLDGVPESHNEIRASNRAFETMERCLEGVRDSGIPFGFIFTLTQFNVHELDWVAQFALEQGAGLLQIHPLEGSGRASEEMHDAVPDEMENACAFLEAARIQELAGERMQVQLDLLDGKLIRCDPARVFADTPMADSEMPFSGVVSPIVIESDATVVPIQHGFPRRYALGNLEDARLRDLMASWRKQKQKAFRGLCRQAWEEVSRPSELPFSNWYEVMARTAQQESGLVAIG